MRHVHKTGDTERSRSPRAEAKINCIKDGSFATVTDPNKAIHARAWSPVEFFD